MYPCNMRTCYWLLRLVFHSFELTFVALPATFRHVCSPQSLHLSLHVSSNMRTCYWLPRLVFHSFEFTFVFPGLMQHAHMLQIAQTHVSQSHCSRIPRKRVPQETIPLVANGVALPATFRHVTSQQGSHLSPHVPCNVRTCYWLRRLVFQALSLHLRPCL
jgi:hypothetical protein